MESLTTDPKMMAFAIALKNRLAFIHKRPGWNNEAIGRDLAATLARCMGTTDRRADARNIPPESGRDG